ncbi:Hypothetical protein CINCED_3A001849, partial [Cinara cedri]
DFDIYVQKTYKIIGNLVTIFEHRTRENRRLGKEYVRTVEFNVWVSEVIANNILKSLCKKNTLETNEITKSLLDEYKTFSSSNNETIMHDFQIGIASGIAEILTGVNDGIIFPKIKNAKKKENQQNNFAEVVKKPHLNFCHKNYVIEKRWEKVSKHMASVNLRAEKERNLEQQIRRVENKHRPTIPPPPSNTVKNILSHKPNLMDKNNTEKRKPIVNTVPVKKQLTGAKSTAGGSLLNETSEKSSLPRKRSVIKKSRSPNRKENIKKPADNLQTRNIPHGNELSDKLKNPLLVEKSEKLPKTNNKVASKQLTKHTSDTLPVKIINDHSDGRPTAANVRQKTEPVDRKQKVKMNTTSDPKTANTKVNVKKPADNLQIRNITNGNELPDKLKNPLLVVKSEKLPKTNNKVANKKLTKHSPDTLPVKIINDHSDEKPTAANVRQETEPVDRKQKVKMNMTSDPKTENTKVNVKKSDGQKSVSPKPPVKSVVMSDVVQIDEVCKSDETLITVNGSDCIVGISGKETLPAKPEVEKQQKNDTFDGKIPLETAKDEITATEIITATPDDEVATEEILLATLEDEIANGGTPTSMQKNHTSDEEIPISIAKDDKTSEETMPATTNNEAATEEILLATLEDETANGGTPTSMQKNHTSNVQTLTTTPKNKTADGSTTSGGKAFNENILTETATKMTIGQPKLAYVKNERLTGTDGALKEQGVNDEKNAGKNVWSNHCGPVSKFPDVRKVKTLNDRTNYVCLEKSQSNYAGKNVCT